MEVYIDLQKKAKLAKLHEIAVKAAQQMTAATPGTVTKARREKAYETAQKEFYKALGMPQ